MTPYETMHVTDAYSRRLRSEARQALAMSWHTAAFQRPKRMPSLKEVLDNAFGDGRRHEMDPDQIKAALMSVPVPHVKKGDKDGA